MQPSLTIMPAAPALKGAYSDYTGMEVVHFPSYMSPTSLVQYEKNPNRFFLERMVVNPRPRDPQSMAMAAGSAFDFEVKKYLLLNKLETNFILFKERFLKGLFTEEQKAHYADMDLFQAMFETAVEPHNREEASKVGKILMSQYVEVLDSNTPSLFSFVRFVDVEQHYNFMLNATNPDGSPVSVPLFGKLDASVITSGSPGTASAVPFDWKVSGYGSETGRSPKPRYAECWVDGVPQGPHKDWVQDIPFDAIDEDWATQGCTYGWLMGRRVGKPFHFVIDMLAIRLTSVRVARYIGVITPEFQVKTAIRYINAWKGIKNLEILNRIGKTRALCEVLANNENWWG